MFSDHIRVVRVG